MLLEDFDFNKTAVINPENIYHSVKNFPETVVSIFSWQLFNSLVELLHGEKICELHDADGLHPVYAVNYKGKRLAFVKAHVGAPACVATFEDIGRFGGRRFILLGNCGTLGEKIEDMQIIIPNRALRDEGTSYHYAPASDSIPVNHLHIDTFKNICEQFGFPYVEGTTWTTDAFYRETPAKFEKRKEMGAICVEMECASMQAMCDFRGYEFFQFFYAGDKLTTDHWDERSLSGFSNLSNKQKIAMLAFDLAAAIA